VTEGFEVTGTTGVIATGPPDGARAGARVFERRGNAMDATAAACLVCAVMEPQAVDVGGYVFAAVILDGKTGRVWSIDSNSVAPKSAREEMYDVLPVRAGAPGINEIEYGCSVRDDANIYGPLSVGVPGFVAGVGILWERWGQLKWPEITAPAQELVEAGLRYSLVRESILAKRDAIEKFPSTASILLPGGTVPALDQPWPRSDLARTLRRLETVGWHDFYDGEIGRAIADFVESQGGILTRTDMAGFSPRITDPASSTYHRAEIHTAIAPNGGFSVLEALNDIEAQELPSDRDPRYWTQWADVLQRTWHSRLNQTRAGATRHGTVHVAAADNQGNLVSATISQGGLFGSCLAVPGTGIMLGHGMCRFDPHPGLDNSPGPGKRPLNNVCPLVIRTPDREIAIGARGGRRIVSVLPQIAQRIIDEGVSTRAASTAPRMHTMTGDPLEISHNFNADVRRALESMGHHIEVPNEVAGAAHGAEILKSTGQLRAGGNTWAAGI
jgi:gamma-glutamyltranspeptidase/glutathione hydrolase